MNLIHKRTASVLFTIVAFTLFLSSIYVARRPLTVFVFAILFAYLLNPIVSRIQKLLRCSRASSVLATYLLLGAVTAGLGVTAGPRAFKEGLSFGKALPALIENVGTGQIAQEYGSRHRWDVETQVEAKQFLATHREAVTAYTKTLVNRVAGLAGYLVWVILIPILAAFLLKDHAHFGDELFRVLKSDQDRHFLRTLLHDLDVMLSGFMRAQLTFAALGLVAYTTILLVVGFPYALAVGGIAGLLEFIPFVGPLITFILIMGVAILTGAPHWLAVLVFLALWRGIQDYISSPYLMGRRMKLHPLAVICAVLIGGEIAGVIGLFLAVPILASLRIGWKVWRMDPRNTSLAAGKGSIPNSHPIRMGIKN